MPPVMISSSSCCWVALGARVSLSAHPVTAALSPLLPQVVLGSTHVPSWHPGRDLPLGCRRDCAPARCLCSPPEAPACLEAWCFVLSINFFLIESMSAIQMIASGRCGRFQDCLKKKNAHLFFKHSLNRICVILSST